MTKNISKSMPFKHISDLGLETDIVFSFIIYSEYLS